MSAELLRRAAAELRDAATHALPSPWAVRETSGGSRLTVISEHPTSIDGQGRPTTVAQRATTIVVSAEVKRHYRANVAYVALMHPDVALGLADWLDGTADVMDGLGLRDGGAPFSAPFAVARAILGEVS